MAITKKRKFSLDYLPPDKTGSIPARYVPHHEFCFYLHDMIGHLLVEIEGKDFRSARFDITDSDNGVDDASGLIDALLKTRHRPKAARLMLNHVLVALTSDYLHFVYEALISLSKRKFAVSFSLLRKPFKENLLHLAWMLGDSESYFLSFEADPAKFMESRKADILFRTRIIEGALSRSVLPDSFDSSIIERIIYDKDDIMGLASLFDKATHLVTSARALRTEPMNLNFIFKDPRDDDVFSSSYSSIALILMYSFAILTSEVDKVASLDVPYVRRRLLIAFMVYQSLFDSGPPTLFRVLERQLGDFYKCTVCHSPLKAKKPQIARLLVSERFVCGNCSSDIQLPILWFMNAAQVEIVP